jgi:hypothetical protein
MQQLQGREFSIEQPVSLQFTESSWNGFIRILFQIPAELKKQLPIDPRTSDPKTTLQKILESDIWAIKEGNNLLLLSRCFVLPCTLVQTESYSFLKVHSCRQTSDVDAVTAFNEGVLIKAQWVILLPEDSLVSTTAAESLYSFFFPENSMFESAPKIEKKAVQPAVSVVVPPQEQPVAQTVVPTAIPTAIPTAVPTAVPTAAPKEVESVVAPTFSEMLASASSAATVIPGAPTASAVSTSTVPSVEAAQAAQPAPSASSFFGTPIAEQKPVFGHEKPIDVAAQEPASAFVQAQTFSQMANQNLQADTEKVNFNSVENSLDWNSTPVQVSGQSEEKLHFNFLGDEKSNSLSEFEKGQTLFSWDNKSKSTDSMPEAELYEGNKGNVEDSTGICAEKSTVKIEYSEGYTVEASPDFVNELLKKPGSTTSEVSAPAADSSKKDSTSHVSTSVNTSAVPPAAKVPAFDNNRIFGGSSTAPLKQNTIDEIIAKLTAANNGANANESRTNNMQSQPITQSETPVPPVQRTQAFMSQPVNRTMATEPVTRNVTPVVQTGFGTPTLGQQVPPLQTNRMGMSMAQPIEAAKPSASRISASTNKAEGEPLMSQSQIDALIASLKGGQ